jgi:transcriptional regulator with XRE-family HTH domain
MKPEMIKQSFRAQFGYRLRECRKRQRFTQTQLGKEIEITNTTIGQWEKGAYLPTLEHFSRLLKVLDVKPEALLPPV